MFFPDAKIEPMCHLNVDKESSYLWTYVILLRSYLSYSYEVTPTRPGICRVMSGRVNWKGTHLISFGLFPFVIDSAFRDDSQSVDPALEYASKVVYVAILETLSAMPTFCLKIEGSWLPRRSPLAQWYLKGNGSSLLLPKSALGKIDTVLISFGPRYLSTRSGSSVTDIFSEPNQVEVIPKVDGLGAANAKDQWRLDVKGLRYKLDEQGLERVPGTCAEFLNKLDQSAASCTRYAFLVDRTCALQAASD